MSTTRMLSVAPVIACPDVGTTATWYAENFGFEVHLHGEGPRYAFAILCRDGAELMLRCAEASSASGDWDAYIRVEDAGAVHEHAKQRGLSIVEPLRRKEYGQLELTIQDPNGMRLVFGSDVDARG